MVVSQRSLVRIDLKVSEEDASLAGARERQDDALEHTRSRPWVSSRQPFLRIKQAYHRRPFRQGRNTRRQGAPEGTGHRAQGTGAD